MKFCPKCGAKVEEGRKFCTTCGNVLEQKQTHEKAIENHSNLDEVQSAKDINEKIVNNDETIVDNTFVKDSLNDALAQNNEKNSYNNNKEKVNQNNHTNLINEKKPDIKKKNNTGKIVIGIASVAVIIIGAVIGLFYNTIKANYYMNKGNSAYIIEEKLDYAEKAIMCSKNTKTKAFLKQVFSSAADTDIDAAERKLNELKQVLDQNDYKEIASEVTNKKLDKLYDQGKYDEALALFKDVDNLGGDFKKNSHYDNIMFNVIAKVTGTSVANSKNNLEENNKICFENFDDDVYDEVFEVIGGEYYGDDIKINLYKYNDGQYRQIDTMRLNNCWSPEICGIYDYDKNTYGMYLRYYNDDSEVGVGVFDADGEKIQLKGAVFSNNYTKPDDVNNDGIYEILSNSTSMFSYSNKGTSKWYKINSDGSQPSEISGNSNSSSSSEKKDYSNDLSQLKDTDYIFPQSSSEYLSDSDVKDLSKEELAIARNEIFARYGYVFNTQEYADYFNKKSWYSPNPDYDGNIERLNKYEKVNVELIKEYEAK